MRPWLRSGTIVTVALLLSAAATSSGPSSGNCDAVLGVAGYCASIGVTTPAWITVAPRTAGAGLTVCSCNFNSVECDAANGQDNPDLPPCVPPGDTISATPNATLYWTNSGTCSSKKIGGTIKWVCVTPK